MEPSITYVLPQKIELKVPSSTLSACAWSAVKEMNTEELFGVFSISVLQGTTVTRLADLVPAGVDMGSLFFSRKTNDAVYLGVRLALKDAAGESISVAEASDATFRDKPPRKG